MIKRIDIKKFGLFSDYNWELEVRTDPNQYDSTKDVFKKVNIIYGRNYSGKTTLSRIFRCVENGELHEDYENAQFTIKTDEGTINQSNLSYSKQIRVYNTDFVKTNLSWLHDDRGEIRPFTLLGKGNKEIAEKIADLEENIKDIDIKLGTLNKESGSFEEGTLHFKKKIKENEVTKANNNVSNLKKDLINRIRDKANEDIKKNPYYLDQKDTSKYNRDILDREIKDIQENNLDCSLSQEEEDLQKMIIKEDEKNSISSIPPLILSFASYLTKAKDLLTKEIKISKKISESIERDLLNWLKLGSKFHKGMNICEFCQNPISTQRRDELEAFFNKESEELEEAINKEIEKLDLLKNQLKNHPLSAKLTKDIFYVALHSKFDIIKTKWTEAEVNQIKQIDLLKNGLLNRLNELHTPIKDFDFDSIATTNTIDFNPIINELNNLIIENNEKTITVEQEKNEARKVLRYNAIKNFLESIDYDALLEAIEKAKQEEGRVKKDYEQINEIISQIIEKKDNIQNDINKLKTKLNDQSVAAEKINEHLRNFFGHDSIQLKPSEKQIGDEVLTRFVVRRGEEDAKNLSEGECSLVAFCYFMARIEKELQETDAKDRLIIYIDDPISSLDDNHIFFMYGLIESIFVPCTSSLENSLTEFPKYELSVNQLFISTHNLGFLKYLHSLRTFTGTYKEYSSYVSYFFIEMMRKNNESNSRIKLMPLHMRRNITEYVYCFQEIYKMANEDIDYENEYTTVFNIGNNMRKFLEGFIAFKCAGHDKALHLLPYFFTNSTSSQLNRAPNEHSHLAIWLEKGTNILDLPEAKRLSQQILEGIKKSDEIHYTSLCEKIGVTPNVEL